MEENKKTEGLEAVVEVEKNFEDLSIAEMAAVQGQGDVEGEIAISAVTAAVSHAINSFASSITITSLFKK
ncbi:lichenicidin A2 family type 2 lantibiotic [Enterococcus sp.]|uniref:lichenicidin A2 family type 2 lantibiotic n=1 Tax=Enterococcus sp. TaxID=35783 RepID=UPI0028A802F8|nr:lichenicidin A2 family type 2 lantibiotic [Enterococcus sp.]